jgi:RNA-directed DNA polymerase
MRSLPKGTFERIIAIENLWHAWCATARGKRRGPAVARYGMTVERDLFALQRELLADRYRPRPWRLRIVRDPKPRLIAAPAVRDRVVHGALLGVIGEHFMRRSVDTHFTRGRGGGVHQAVLAFLAMNRRYHWRLHLDIARYFPSIDHGILLSLLCREIRDPRVCGLIEILLQAGLAVYRSPEARQLGLSAPGAGEPPRGLPLGSWLSQWAGAYYLDGLDHLVKRTLKVPGYLRYMDDFVLFSDDRRALEEARAAVTVWLAAERRLGLNPKLGRIEPGQHPTVFLGHRISRSGIAPSRRLRRRLPTRLAAAAVVGPEALRRTLESYRGLMWIR